ncbi:hypothetical protein BS47DRAFT_596301 [Hydnum rufescens UP504]|uniref:Uncharacterized protein n=1 Tax=Hydnum rufescens UP504 TaxID=1448309 RepID=A0A9P6AFZ1_9AGAM|nr:hypothetical protein BS47DRAFT_596301 [Hydnum rufescens UP504]
MNAPMIGDHCEWSPKTAPWWIRMLCRTLEFLKTAVSVDQGLSKLMLLLKLPLRDVFELYSMRILLSGPGPYPASNPDSAPGSPSDHVDDNVDIDDEDPRELPDRDIPGSALRYLGNVVAWRRAILYVYRGVQKHMGDISLTLVLTPAPVSRRACAPMNPIVARAILKAFDSLGIEDPHRRSLLTETVNNKLPTQTAFTGTVHCEASLMGLIVSSVVDVGPLPNYLTKETVESTFKRLTTETGFVTIGVGKKCCWCCAWLAKRLHIAHPEIKFDIPRSHGQMYPWALPPVGVTVEDALALEGELEGILDRVVRRVVEETSISNALTNTSSTLGSISPGSEPDLDSEYEAMLESAVRREWD